jgi:glycosyltransferase involved in cell wall biosynthesis
MIYYIPLENLDERYTRQMFRWVITAFRDRGIEFRVIHGETLVQETEGDQFLNWASRVFFTSEQNKRIARLFQEGRVNDGDIFFVADIWHPGIESIPYMADAMGINVKIYGINYAGPFDPTDPTHRMIRWGGWFEVMAYSFFTGVFVGSDYHARLIRKGFRGVDYDFLGLPRAVDPFLCPLHVTGLVWDEHDATEGIEPMESDRPIIIWPHRLSPEKNVDQFYQVVQALSGKYPRIRWVISSSRMNQEYSPVHSSVEFVRQSKKDYYRMMKGSILMVSTAYHENYGYTVREATALGTPILCPRRADYPEMIESPRNLYDDHELIERVEDVIRWHHYLPAGTRPVPVAKLKPFRGIDRMIDIMIGG